MSLVVTSVGLLLDSHPATSLRRNQICRRWSQGWGHLLEGGGKSREVIKPESGQSWEVVGTGGGGVSECTRLTGEVPAA